VRVTIDPDACTGHGRCYTLAAGVFDSDDRGLGVVSIEGDIPAELEKVARQAVANCPEQAISIVE
jgi:ferredoxin